MHYNMLYIGHKGQALMGVSSSAFKIDPKKTLGVFGKCDDLRWLSMNAQILLKLNLKLFKHKDYIHVVGIKISTSCHGINPCVAF